MTFRHTNEQTLGEVIKQLISDFKLDKKLSEARVIDSWEKIVGTMIAKHTVQLRIVNRILYVEVDSAAMRNELSYAREKIRKKLNKIAGEEMLKEVVFK
jgi:predicted nucleic acid-binding Zn ribbon protein